MPDVRNSIDLNVAGALTTSSKVRTPIAYALYVEQVLVEVGTAPTGAALIVDVKKNGTTIFTTTANRPTVAISGFSSPTTGAGSGVPDVTNFAAGDVLEVDVTQVGSTVAGSDLGVAILNVSL